MPLELKVKTKGKDATYTREETPMMENLLDALKIQRQEVEMFSNPKEQPSDAQNKRRIELLAEFAAKFWGHGLTKSDILTGVSSIEGFNQIETAVSQTLGMNISDDEEADENSDKGENPKE